jgi:hypothetical protein
MCIERSGAARHSIANCNEPQMAVVRYDFRDQFAKTRDSLDRLCRFVDAIETDLVADPSIDSALRLRAIDALRDAMSDTEAELKLGQCRRTVTAITQFPTK